MDARGQRRCRAPSHTPASILAAPAGALVLFFGALQTLNSRIYPIVCAGLHAS